jgi:subtilisin family serine protease
MSKAANEIYTRAVNELDIVLVAASGNDNSDTKYFPASHPSVVSVGAMKRCLGRSYGI